MYILTGHEDFLKDLIDGFPFVVVCGDSGTGKTTLVSKVLGDIASESVGIVILKEGLHTKKVIMEKLSLRAVENKLLRHDSVIFFIEKIDSIMPVLRPLVEANIAGMPKECAVVATLSTEFEKCQWDFVKNKAMLCYLNLDDVISPFMWEQVKLYIGKQDRARQDSIHKSIQELRGSLGVRGLFKLLRLSEMNSFEKHRVVCVQNVRKYLGESCGGHIPIWFVRFDELVQNFVKCKGDFFERSGKFQKILSYAYKESILDKRYKVWQYFLATYSQGTFLYKEVFEVYVSLLDTPENLIGCLLLEKDKKQIF